ncbi:putative molybdenum carrier protein [Maribellus sediminis]|uniref:putative molybdenum carrier protein n=1 Tax=Maribellus sediminis TaxID=2696285 RepID=UPI0014301120|nr:putative molybdenum carrier protein [Maribellus sediminis]
MVKNNLQILCQKFISGGQTGVDRGTLDACIAKKFPCGGWCPSGRRAEDGIIPAIYPLLETKEAYYATRTGKNISDSDATLILFGSENSPGTKLTAELAQNFNKPVRTINPEIPIKAILIWLYLNRVKTLNIAGPRESEHPGCQLAAYQFVSALIDEIRKNN